MISSISIIILIIQITFPPAFHFVCLLIFSFSCVSYLSVLQEHVQGFRQPTELSNLLPLEEICELDRVTNRPYFIINKISREIRLIKDCPLFTSRERQGVFFVCVCLSVCVCVCEYVCVSVCVFVCLCTYVVACICFSVFL